jgi:hypothetical protein
VSELVVFGVRAGQLSPADGDDFRVSYLLLLTVRQTQNERFERTPIQPFANHVDVHGIASQTGLGQSEALSQILPAIADELDWSRNDVLTGAPPDKMSSMLAALPENGSTGELNFRSGQQDGGEQKHDFATTQSARRVGRIFGKIRYSEPQFLDLTKH